MELCSTAIVFFWWIIRERWQMPWHHGNQARSFINYEETCASAKIFPKTWRIPGVDFADTRTRMPRKSQANKRSARQLIRRGRRWGECASILRVYVYIYLATLAGMWRLSASKRSWKRVRGRTRRWVHDMSCCAWLASTFFQPPRPSVHQRSPIPPEAASSPWRRIHCHIDPP